ncbi:MAG: AraC family transcriptional regulator [Moraxellaceae bacterium]|nr:AraC family transcriptional regulator [Moraxellaceae bacterium]
MAAHWDFPRNIASLRILAGLGREHGLSDAACLADTGLDAAELLVPDRMVEAAQELQVIRNLIRHLGRERPLGLEAGMRYHPTTFGIWGFALQSSPTARDAVEVGIRYVRLTSAFCNPRIVEAGSEAMLITDDHDLPEDVREFLVERDGAMILSLQRDVLPMRLPLTRLDLRQPAPPYAAHFEALFGIPARFGQPHNAIGINSALGDMRLPQGDFSAFRLMEAECQRLLESRQLRTGLAGRLRDALLRQSRQMPGMNEMAQEEGITARTLRRRLASEGTDYETLVSEVRRLLAEELLKTTDLSIEDIAERLGYSEQSCFTRAFRRWSGQSPRQYRAAHSHPAPPPAHAVALPARAVESRPTENPDAGKSRNKLRTPLTRSPS